MSAIYLTTISANDAMTEASPSCRGVNHNEVPKEAPIQVNPLFDQNLIQEAQTGLSKVVKSNPKTENLIEAWAKEAATPTTHTTQESVEFYQNIYHQASKVINIVSDFFKDQPKKA